MKDFCFITCQPDDTNFMWEVEVQIHNLRKYNLSSKLKVLVFWREEGDKKNINLHWFSLKRHYPEVEFNFIKGDDKEISPFVLTLYVSILRPYCLKKYWKEHPEMQNKTVFYLDSDVIFTKNPIEHISDLIEDDICYVSDTRSYLGIEYMQSKAKEVNLDSDHFIKLAASLVRISPEKIIENNINTGGAQYLLKNIPTGFWDKVEQDCLMIRRRFMIENQRHFQQRGIERGLTAEDAGIQSWCADMWAVLYNLYFFQKSVKAHKIMDFAWATDKIERVNSTMMLHNAGVGGENSKYLFDKANYRSGRPYVNKWPFQEDLDYVNPEYGSYRYVQEIKETYKDIIDELRKNNTLQSM